MSDVELAPGAIAWATLEPVRGREQGGHRPVLIVSAARHLDLATTLVMVVPLTTVDRRWPNHVAASGRHGLARPSWIMTEQVRTITRERITGVSGEVSLDCLARVQLWLRDFLDL